MQLVSRPLADQSDRVAMADLVRAFPQTVPHVIDLPYHLSTDSAHTPQNTRLWEDAQGKLCGWAIIQMPFWELDYAYDPSAQAEDIERQILLWGKEQLLRLAQEADRHVLYVSCREDWADRRALLLALGFQCDADWHHVEMRYVPARVEQPMTLADGFVIRPLAGESEAAAYVVAHRAAFGSANMTVSWREQTLLQPGYCAATDLVIAAPDGTIAAFCIGWLLRDQGQIEPIGVLPQYQRRGLGRTLLQSSIQRLQQQGARELYIWHNGDNDASAQLYAQCGFRPIHRFDKYYLKA